MAEVRLTFGDKWLESDSVFTRMGLHPSQRYLKLQNTQHSKWVTGDGAEKRQVRGSDKDREPELQNSDSHFYF